MSTPERMARLVEDGPIGDLWLSGDCLELYFFAPRDGFGSGLMVATRASRDEPFVSAVALEALEPGRSDLRVVFSGDGRRAIVAGHRGEGSGRSDLFGFERSDTLERFVASGPLTALNSPEDEYDHWWSSDEQRLYFSRTTPQGGQDLYVSEREDLVLGFGEPRRLPLSQAGSVDDSPVLTRDEKLLIFSSDRAGGHGSQDLWFATRPDRQAAFSQARPVPLVNTASYEGEVALACDDSEIWFVRNFDSAVSWDVYRARILLVMR